MNDNNLTKRAIAAYEESELKRSDLEFSARARDTIQRFVSMFGFVIAVDSNPFEIDGVRLYVDPQYVDHFQGAFPDYILDASRKCPSCKADLSFQVDNSCTAALFGQWLSQIHACEFEKRKPVQGLTRRTGE